MGRTEQRTSASDALSSDGTPRVIASLLENHPRPTSVLFATLLALTQARSTAAAMGGTID